jgi:hypothetical protein
VAYFEVPYLFGETEDNNEKPQSGYPTSNLRYETKASETQFTQPTASFDLISLKQNTRFEPIKTHWLLYVTPGLTLKHSTFSPRTVCIS